MTINTGNMIKRFGKDTIISGPLLNARPDEFFTFLEPSEYGKTTLLCMIIGSNFIEDDGIKIDSKIISNIPANKRNMGMMFRNYIILPHVSVRDNMVLGLKNRKILQDQIESQVDEILKMVKIDHPKKRMPSKPPGGQQQRVALTKVIVIHLEVLLMDEPLPNPDVELRIEMRNTIEHIQRRVGITTTYVTHGQEEALAVSDHIVITNSGVIQQINTPKNVYQRLSNTLMSTFTGLSNTMDERIEAKDGQTFLYIGDYSVPMGNLFCDADDGQAMKVSVWPEEFITNREGSDDIPAVVRSSVFPGITTHYSVEITDGREIEII